MLETGAGWNQREFDFKVRSGEYLHQNHLGCLLKIWILGLHSIPNIVVFVQDFTME